MNISYNSEGVTKDGVFYPSDNPRLLFCKMLAEVEQSNEMIPKTYGNVFHERTVIGDGSVYGANCVIGGPGFGYEYDEDGTIIPMPHLGNVVIGNNVTIHNNVCIDRAVLGSTVIGDGTKIDNLVHVAHGVKIGKHCLIVSGVVFGGQCEIGDYTFVGMNVSVKQKVKIGRNCVIGAGAVVTKDIPDNQIWVGNPAAYLKDTEPRKYL